LTLVEQFTEHLNTSTRCLECWLDTDDFNLFTNFNDTALDTTGYYRTAAGDREHIFYWHQEGAVDCTLWCWDKGI